MKFSPDSVAWDDPALSNLETIDVYDSISSQAGFQSYSCNSDMPTFSTMLFHKYLLLTCKDINHIIGEHL